MKVSIEIYRYELDFLYKFLTLVKEIHEDDLFLVISARKGTVSYHSSLDEVPGKLERYFHKHNFIIIYPEQTPAAPQEKIISTGDLEISPD